MYSYHKAFMSDIKTQLARNYLNGFQLPTIIVSTEETTFILLNVDKNEGI